MLQSSRGEIMTLDEAEEYFGSLYQACRGLNIARQNVTKWRKKGYIPLLQQYRIAELTEGELMPDTVDPKISYAEIQSKKGLNG